MGFEFNLRFPGQYYDSETGLHYNYFRDYDPSTGRYLQSDPIGIQRDYSNPQLQLAIEIGALDETQFANEELNHIYGYVGQNPLAWMDSYGLAASGNHKLDADQVARIKEQLQDPNLDKKTRNSLSAKLKRHEKATGVRHSRHSKDKKKLKPKMGIGPTFIGPFACDIIGPSPYNPFCLPEAPPDC